MQWPEGTDLGQVVEIPGPDGSIRQMQLRDVELVDLERRLEWLKSGEGAPTAFDWEFLEAQSAPDLGLG